jgi:hypothetical protein
MGWHGVGSIKHFFRWKVSLAIDRDGTGSLAIAANVTSHLSEGGGFS